MRQVDKELVYQKIKLLFQACTIEYTGRCGSATILVPEKPMILDPASTIRQEVRRLIDMQIETLTQTSSLDESQLLAYAARAERIRGLYVELDRIGWTQLKPRSAEHPEFRLAC